MEPPRQVLTGLGLSMAFCGLFAPVLALRKKLATPLVVVLAFCLQLFTAVSVVHYQDKDPSDGDLRQ